MGIGDKFTAFLKDPIGEGKKIFNQGKDVLNEKPEYYRSVRDLETLLHSIRNDKKNQGENNEQALIAAGLLEVELKNARTVFDNKIEKFYKEGMSPINYKNAMYEFTQNCNNAIHKYQPTLMAAPNIWSQLKASINNLAEQYLGIKDLLEIDKSEQTSFSQNSTFKNKLDEIKEGKKDMEANENDTKFTPKGLN